MDMLITARCFNYATSTYWSWSGVGKGRQGCRYYLCSIPTCTYMPTNHLRIALLDRCSCSSAAAIGLADCVCIGWWGEQRVRELIYFKV